MSTTDVQSLPPEIYHLVVAPPLQVTADLAAARGDPDLCNDMASMLALLTLVRGLAAYYNRSHPENGAAEALAGAPMGACVMVLQRVELEPEQISDCVWALEAAETQLHEAGVIGPEHEMTERAGLYLSEDEPDRAREVLNNAAQKLVKNIDQWERARR